MRRQLSVRYAQTKKRTPSAGLHAFMIGPCALAIAVLLLCLAVYIGSRALRQAEFLKVHKVHVTGCMRFQEQDIVQLCGLHGGEHIMTIDLHQLSTRLESNPWIYRAVVKRTLPDTITIQIEERQPCAVIQLDEWYLVDRRGEVFKKVASCDQGLPLLVGFTPEDLTGRGVEALQLRAAAFRLLESLQRSSLTGYPANTLIELDKTRGLTISAGSDNTRVLLGFDAFDQKLAIAPTIISDLRQRGLVAQTINLKSLHKAYVTVNNISEARG